MAQNFEIFIAALKKYWPLFLIVGFFILLSFPNRLGKSLYTANELPRDLEILQLLHQGHFILIGPDSCLGNFHFGPVYYYLIYPVALFFDFAPFSLAISSLISNALTIFFAFFVAKKWWQSNAVAYTTAFLIATSNFTFQFSQYGSNPNFLPLFSLVFFYCLERIIANKKNFWLIFSLAASFSICIQLHAVPMICLPIILLLLLLFKKIRFNFKEWVIFGLICFLINFPYLYYEFTHAFVNLRALISITQGASGTHTPVYERIIEYIGFWLMPVISVQNFFNIVDIIGTKLVYWLAITLVVLAILLKYESYHLKPFKLSISLSPSAKTVLWCWLVVPTFVILVPSGSVNGLRIYYFLMMFPLIFFLLAWGIVKLLNKGFLLSLLYGGFFYLLLQFIHIHLYRQQVARLITWVYK